MNCFTKTCLFLGVGITLILYKPISTMAAEFGEACVFTDTIEYKQYQNPAPWEAKNNKFGIYTYAEEEVLIDLADNLVNSNGGDWGYVLIPYNVKDRDTSKWEKVFDKLNKKHLIPIIQLHDVDVKHYKIQTKEAALFLNKFLWPIKHRYISVYNEPNDDAFWYGDANPKEYAEILNYTIDAFKQVTPNYFMLNGAFNVSAHPSNQYYDSFDFMKKMNDTVPGIFSKLDGWASHSYPQPNFSGTVNAKGRNSITAYKDELQFLSSELGVLKKLKVFITETGWAHAEGQKYNPNYLPVSEVANRIEEAYKSVWLKDDDVQAVMPFTIRYNPPHDHFSWVNVDNVPYEHFQRIREIKKVAGKPENLIDEKVNLTYCTNN
ncbi:MAG: hypothetical protein R3B92_03310 [Patescibacteria group bacterium]